ncbi:Cytochrome P450 [Corchorus olitorius]|uniref:Cytochrome P450 n=1 Tax=Corchorus olitorius TaxID=93759 RepID=A0A1R3JE72_9ROSI|nr:Cytochrome P450 [Corchorus olitorius]
MLTSMNNKLKAGSFLPFGAGSRICPGADLAKLEISILLHYFLLNYNLKRINPGGPIVYLPLPRPLDNCLAEIIKEEQVEIIKRRPSSQKGLTLNEIRQMQYLSKAIDETLRRSSISFSIFRKAEVDVKINDYIIPKGWKVLVWNRAVHMDSETFPNPEEFLTSRWENHTPKAGSFIPFGAGSKICPGADLAKLEMYIFLHYFLLNYRFERINPGSPIQYLTSPRPKDNCLAKIIKQHH